MASLDACVRSFSTGPERQPLTRMPNSDKSRCHCSEVVQTHTHTHTHTHKHFSEPGYAKGSAGVKSWSNLIQAWIKSQVSNLEVERKHTGKFFGFWEAEERGREHLGSIWMGNERRGGAAAVCSACWGKWYRTVFPTLAPEITSA